MRRHGVEPLVDGALQLRLRLGEQFAHLLHAGAKFDDPLVGHLGGGHLLGGALRRGGVFRGRPRPRDEHGEARNGEPHDQTERNEDGGFHECVLRDSVFAIPPGAGLVDRILEAGLGGRQFSTRTNREHIDPPKSSP